MCAGSEKVMAETDNNTYRITLLGDGGKQEIKVTSCDDKKCTLKYKVVKGLDFPLTSLQGEVSVYDGVTIEWSAEADAVFGFETAFKCQLGNAIRAKLDEMLAGLEVGLRKRGGGGVVAAAASAAAGSS